MGRVETSKIGKRGTVVIPAQIRKHFGLEEGNLILIEEQDTGVLIRRAVALPVETYTPERKAEFILNNAVDKADYARAAAEVKRMGLDPKNIRRRKPRK